MSEKYVRNQKDPGGSKYLCAQDEEDFEQEKAIKDWLEREGRADDFGYQHINRKGTARNTLVRAQVRLDAQIQTDETGTFADRIAGSDGRDLECAGGAGSTDDADANTAPFYLAKQVDAFLDGIGADERTREWVKKSLKQAPDLMNLRSLMKEEKPFEISPISLGCLKPLGSFKE